MLWPWLCGRGACYERRSVLEARWLPPNMRLKLSGDLVGRIALPRRRAFLSAARSPCARGHCARSFKRDPLGSEVRSTFGFIARHEDAVS